MNRLVFSLLSSFLSSGVFAVGLGELNRQPTLGERLQLEINVNGAGKERLDASCYRLRQPAGGEDVPWVKAAKLAVRQGPQPVLEIRSSQIVHDPILLLSVHLACGHEISRDYVLFPSPAREGEVVAVDPVQLPKLINVESAPPEEKKAPPRRLDKHQVTDLSAPVSPSRRTAAQRMAITGTGLPDRLLLSGGGEAGDPSLRFSSELLSIAGRGVEVSEQQREVLRLEFRMLQALQEQALTQLAASEKLRTLDKGLLDLQKGTAVIEKPLAAPVVSIPAETPLSASPVIVPSLKPSETSLLDEWGLYALLALTFAGVAGWLAWKEYLERRNREEISNDFVLESDFPVREVVRQTVLQSMPPLQQPPVVPESMASGLPVESAVHIPLPPLDNSEGVPAESVLSDLNFGATTLDESFEANPVMELADIMLSFGRVKGAAQALQEYIDANPQEALQPWMRLLEVYRMAGMRAEFEELALNLNKNFNVEIQYWESPVVTAASVDESIDFVLEEVTPAKADRLEDMPRIMQQIIERWPSGDAGGFIYELLRDNRGGARLGFSLGVVEEMLFLIELKETILRMEKEKLSEEAA